MKHVNNTIIKIFVDENGKGRITIIANKRILNVVLLISERNGDKKYRFAFAGSEKTTSWRFIMEKIAAWSVTSPNLYDYSAEVEFDDGKEVLTGSFGCRRISQNGKNICLNGTPIFIRGYIRGATAHDHSNNCKLSKEDFYRKNIKVAKKYGFNLVRFHSVVPDEEFFKVADEEGLLVHIEMRLPDDIYNNLREMQTSGNVLVPDEYIEEIVNKYYNHPSLAVYCIGNEIKDVSASRRIGEICSLIERLDGTRLFLDTCAWGANGRPFVDIDVQHLSYYFPYGKHADMYENTENLLVVGGEKDKPLRTEGKNAETIRELTFSVPLIAHETCHYTALRDFNKLKEKYEKYGTPKPWWIEEELKMIKAKGYEEVYPEMYKASKYFQLGCWKTAFEAMRSSELLGGFHFLQLADTDVYENSNGVIDCFDDESAVPIDKFLQFNGDKVILTDLKKRNYIAGQILEVRIMLSNLGETDCETVNLRYSIIGEQNMVYAVGEMKNLDVSKSGLLKLCKARILLPEVGCSEKLTFKVVLDKESGVYAENEWNIWVYKKCEPLSYSEFINYENNDVVITSDINKAFTELEKRKKVCLIYRSDFTRHVIHKDMKNPEYAFKVSWNRFKPVIWDRGTNYGGLLEREILNEYGFSTDGYYDYNLSVLSEDCDKINLDDFPVNVKNIISGIDKSCRDRFDAYKDCFNMPDLIYDRTLRNFSYMFEVAVDKGRLLVCGLNFTALDELEPSTHCMANFIIDYMQSEEFNPMAKISLCKLKSYMKKCAEKPVIESIMTQFWEMDDAPVESKLFWKESKEYLAEEYAKEHKK